MVDFRRMKWDHRFMRLAKAIAEWSKDPSTKVGAVIVKDRRIIATGYNGFPAGIEDGEERLLDREVKYRCTLHAEANAILNAVAPVEGATIYTYPFPPCHECAKLIIQSGIERVVAREPMGKLNERWGESLSTARELFREAGVKIREISAGLV